MPFSDYLKRKIKQAKGKKMLKKLWWLIVILLMAIAFAAGYYCFALQHKNSAATRKAPVSDTLALAAAAITPRDIEFTQ